MTGYDGWPLSDGHGDDTVGQQGSRTELSFEVTMTDEGNEDVS